ncbi:MAG: hypothetical protein AAF724_12830 [Pseudomonadota bacterium]
MTVQPGRKNYERRFSKIETCRITSVKGGDLARSDIKQDENKTRTYLGEPCASATCTPEKEADQLGIERVWREVIDFGETGSGTGEEGWGRKRVSVARISLLDGPSMRDRLRDGSRALSGFQPSSNQPKKRRGE